MRAAGQLAGPQDSALAAASPGEVAAATVIAGAFVFLGAAVSGLFWGAIAGLVVNVAKGGKRRSSSRRSSRRRR